MQAWATTIDDFGASATASRQPRTADRMIVTGHGISGFGGKLGRRGPTRTDGLIQSKLVVVGSVSGGGCPLPPGGGATVGSRAFWPASPVCVPRSSRLAGGWCCVRHRRTDPGRLHCTARVLDIPVTQHCRAVCNSICPHNTHTQHSITSMAPRLACTLREKKTSCSYASSQWPVGGRHQAEISEEIGFASRGWGVLRLKFLVFCLLLLH